MNKYRLGKLLQEQLTRPNIDISKIARWAENIHLNNMKELTSDLLDILDTLAFMELGPEFQLTIDQIKLLSNRLVSEGEKEELSLPMPEIREVASDLGEHWLMCPVCQETWTDQSDYPMLFCPKCSAKIHNPTFKY